MSWFVAIPTLNGLKAISNTIYPLKRDALIRASQNPDLKVMDADHEPGRSILKSRNPFS